MNKISFLKLSIAYIISVPLFDLTCKAQCPVVYTIPTFTPTEVNIVTPPGLINEIKTIEVNPSAIVVGGNFLTTNNAPTWGSRHNIIGLKPNIGGEHSTFITSAGTGPAYNGNSVNTLLTNNLGNIVFAGGDFNTYYGVMQTPGLVGANLLTGILDPSFSVTTGFNISGPAWQNYLTAEEVNCIQNVPLSTSILVGGNFSVYDGTAVNNLVKIKNTGAIDATFTTQTNAMIQDIKVFSSTEAIIAGSFTNVAGTSVNYLAKINPTTGQVDPTFNPLFNAQITDVCIIPTSPTTYSLIVAGTFTAVGGIQYPGIAKLFQSGAVDLTFNPGSGPGGGIIKTIFYHPACNSIYLGGSFTSYNGFNSSKLVSINFGGQYVPSFNVGSGFNNDVNIINMASNGDLLVGGRFTTYNSQGYQYMVRLTACDGSACGLLPVNLIDFTANKEGTGVCLNILTMGEKDNSFFIIQRSKDAVNFKDIDTVYSIGNTNQQVKYTCYDKAPLSGTSYYMFKQVDKNGTAVFSKKISVNFSENNDEFLIYPTDINDGRFVLNGIRKGESYQVIFYDEDGKWLYSKKDISESLENTLSVPANITGCFIVKVLSGLKCKSFRLFARN